MLSQTNCKVIFTGGIIPEYGCEILVYPDAVFIYYLGYKSKNIFQNIKAEVEKTVNDFIQQIGRAHV